MFLNFKATFSRLNKSFNCLACSRNNLKTFTFLSSGTNSNLSQIIYELKALFSFDKIRIFASDRYKNKINFSFLRNWSLTRESPILCTSIFEYFNIKRFNMECQGNWLNSMENIQWEYRRLTASFWLHLNTQGRNSPCREDLHFAYKPDEGWEMACARENMIALSALNLTTFDSTHLRIFTRSCEKDYCASLRNFPYWKACKVFSSA